jgi:hypothetical protein
MESSSSTKDPGMIAPNTRGTPFSENIHIKTKLFHAVASNPLLHIAALSHDTLHLEGFSTKYESEGYTLVSTFLPLSALNRGMSTNC